MTKFGKVWGCTEPLLVTPTVEVHRIEANSGFQCSKHKHNFKWNAFYVIDGVMEIHVHKNDYDLVDITRLNPGDFTTVKPGEYHSFLAIENCTALEIYYMEPLSEDIVRETCGGFKKKPLEGVKVPDGFSKSTTQWPEVNSAGIRAARSQGSREIYGHPVAGLANVSDEMDKGS